MNEQIIKKTVLLLDTGSLSSERDFPWKEAGLARDNFTPLPTLHPSIRSVHAEGIGLSEHAISTRSHFLRSSGPEEFEAACRVRGTHTWFHRETKAWSLRHLKSRTLLGKENFGGSHCCFHLCFFDC